MIRYTVRVGDDVYSAEIDEPEAPICRMCGHRLCPCCADIGTPACHELVEDFEGELDMCPCADTDEGCRVDAAVFARYRAEILRRRELTCFGGSGAFIAPGDKPFRP